MHSYLNANLTRHGVSKVSDDGWYYLLTYDGFDIQ